MLEVKIINMFFFLSKASVSQLEFCGTSEFLKHLEVFRQYLRKFVGHRLTVVQRFVGSNLIISNILDESDVKAKPD